MLLRATPAAFDALDATAGDDAAAAAAAAAGGAESASSSSSSSSDATRRAMSRIELSRVVADLTLHKREIHAKLVSIMRERLSSHLRRLEEDGEGGGGGGGGDGDGDGASASAFATDLSKEVGVMRRIVVGVLALDDRVDVFDAIVRLFDARLAEAHRARAARANGGDARRRTATLRADGALLTETLASLVNGGDGPGPDASAAAVAPSLAAALASVDVSSSDGGGDARGE